MTQINTEIAELIQGLSMAVLKKDAKELSKEDAAFLITMDMESIPIELTVHATDTRKTEVQYCTNTYSAGVKVDLTGVKEKLMSTLEGIEDGPELIKAYLSKKNMLIQFIRFKHESMEGFLRDLLRESEKKDKIVPVGRYSS